MAQRVTQEAADKASLTPMVELVKLTCGSPPLCAVADSGYYSNQNVEQMEAMGIPRNPRSPQFLDPKIFLKKLAGFQTTNT